MANPYGKPQGGFLEDYSNIAAAGSAFQGFVKGMQDAEDRDYKKREFESKMKTMQADAEKNALEMQIKRQQFDPNERMREERIKLAGNNQIPQYDENNNLTGTTYKPEYIEMQKAKADSAADAKRSNAASGLRDDWMKDSVTKATKEVSAGYANMQAAAKNPSPAGDMSMIFSYMKMLDPNSTVREGEYANAQNAASIPDQVRNAYNKAKEGTILNPKQRGDFLTQGQKLYKSRLAAQDRLNKSFEGVASRSKINPRDVVLKEIFDTVPQDDPGLLQKGKMPQGLIGTPPVGDLEAKKRRLEELRAKAAGG